MIMKPHIKRIVQLILKYLAKITLWKYRPGIIGVTGSAGKTSTKIAIAAILSHERTVRFTPQNFNNQFGLPLAIFGEEKSEGGGWFWVKVIGRAILNILRRAEYPEILVLEYGVDRPHDMRYLLSIARPNVAVITAIGEVPAHVEFFSGPQEVAREKARLIEQLPAGGFAVLNQDSEVVMDLKDRTRAHRVTFGFSRDAEVQISNFTTRLENGYPVGISFKLEYAGSFVPVRLDGVFGRAQAYTAAAAASVGLIFGLNLVTISEALKNYHPPKHRFQLFLGPDDSVLIDDAYNASPLSVHAALDTVKDIPSKRKIAILGDMKELGGFSETAHRDIGRITKGIVNILITVGPEARLIGEGALEVGFVKKNIHHFSSVEEVLQFLPELIKKGDLVLVKGSQSVGLEKVIQGLKV